MAGVDFERRLAALRLVAFDVDGVFTDGRFTLSDDGVESKSFHTQDGYGVRRLLDTGIEVAVISGRRSIAVQRRMDELGVRNVLLGVHDKVAAYAELAAELGIATNESAFVGDDLPDLPLLRTVGVRFAVANAVAAVRDACDYTTHAPGGAGAVREICDLIADAQGG